MPAFAARTAVLLVLATLAAALPLRGEIAVLANGRSVKVRAWDVGPERTRLDLTVGGEMVIPTALLERILDDEVVPVPPPPADLPQRAWRFDESSGPMFESPYSGIILEASRKFDVDAALVSAVIKAESDYNPKVVSRKGARGLMQLMPATAKRFGVTDAFDPHANIHAGTKYLRWLLDRFDGNVEMALAGYNAGEGNVARYNGVPPFRETVEYIQRIGRHFERQRGIAIISG